GWTPSELDLPGWGMLRTGPRDVPEHIQLWYMNDDHVQALPERTPWNRPEPGLEEAEPEPYGDDDDGDGGGGNWIGAQGAVMDTLRQHGPRTLTQLGSQLDFSRSMIDRALKELSAAGRVEKAGGYGAGWPALRVTTRGTARGHVHLSTRQDPLPPSHTATSTNTIGLGGDVHPVDK